MPIAFFMDAIRNTVIILGFLLASGCAGIDRAAETPAAQTADNDSGESRSRHVINIPQEPVTPPVDRVPEDVDTPVTVNEEVIEVIPDFWEQLRQGFRLPDAQQPAVTRRTAEYGSNPRQVERIFKRGEPYLAYILNEVQKRNFPTEIVLLPFIESGYDPFAYSYGRAAGMWQFIAGTGKLYGLHQDWWYDGRRDVVESTQAALN